MGNKTKIKNDVGVFREKYRVLCRQKTQSASRNVYYVGKKLILHRKTCFLPAKNSFCAGKRVFWRQKTQSLGTIASCENIKHVCRKQLGNIFIGLFMPKIKNGSVIFFNKGFEIKLCVFLQCT